jgi:D-glucosaminate-specific PTS system IIB component
MVYRTYNVGCKFQSLQVGGIGGGQGRTNVVGPIALDKEDGKMLNEMANDGMEIYFQMCPDNSRVEWAEVRNKFYKDLPSQTSSG